MNNESANANRVKDSQANTSEEKAPPKRQYKDYITGATYDKKPEFIDSTPRLKYNMKKRLFMQEHYRNHRFLRREWMNL